MLLVDGGESVAFKLFGKDQQLLDTLHTKLIRLQELQKESLDSEQQQPHVVFTKISQRERDLLNSIPIYIEKLRLIHFRKQLIE